LASIREDIKKGVYVEGLTEEVVTNSEEAYAILRKGAKNRQVPLFSAILRLIHQYIVI